ncbi:MAG: RHS repeat-associated core domain-containing protein [Opitutales bacterium]
MKNIKPSEDGSAWAATANGGATLSKFTYEYDPAGRIQEWQQQLGATSADLQTYTFGYTRDNELRDATLRDNTGGLIEERSWQYDSVGNRLRQSLGNNSTYSHYNDLNQIEREGGAGTTLVEGTVDEPAIVEVDVNSEGYKRAAVLSNPGAGNFLFRREVEVAQGLNTIDVRAEDASGNQSTVKNYELTLPAVAKTYEYDLNGNLRFERDSVGSVLREFRWDAQNRLTHIIEGSNETEFEYDAEDRRRRIIERVGGVEQSNETYIWIEGEIVQKRNSTSDTVLRNYYWFGFSEGVSDYFYTRDHLGSIREVLASNGTTIESRYDYDLWGNVTRTAGTGVESDFLYTGHFYHIASDLHLAQYRAYDSELGRWLSRDPALFIDGPNLYTYVNNNPIYAVDPDGRFLNLVSGGIGAAIGGGVGALVGGLQDGWRGALRGGLSGAAGGFVTGATFNPALGLGAGAAVAGGLAGAAGGAVGGLVGETFDAIDGDCSTEFEGSEILKSTVIGGATGVGTGAFSGAFGDVVDPATDALIGVNSTIYGGHVFPQLF